MPRTNLYAMLVLASLLSGCPDALRQDPTQEWIDRHATTIVCYDWFEIQKVGEETAQDSARGDSSPGDSAVSQMVWLDSGALTYLPHNHLTALEGYTLNFDESASSASNRAKGAGHLPMLLSAMACSGGKNQNCGGVEDDQRPENGTFLLWFASDEGHEVAAEDLPFSSMSMTITGDQLQVDYLDAASQPASVAYAIGELVMEW